MPVITVHTRIEAPIERCFGLSCSIDLHKISTRGTQEEAIAGVTSGLVKLGDCVTWRAKHLGFWHILSSEITEMEGPYWFVDEMREGIFKGFRHEHRFEEKDGGTFMTDRFDYESPLGILGKLADVLFLERYMTSFLVKRNAVIKEFAETEAWRQIL